MNKFKTTVRWIGPTIFALFIYTGLAQYHQPPPVYQIIGQFKIWTLLIEKHKYFTNGRFDFLTHAADCPVCFVKNRSPARE